MQREIPARTLGSGVLGALALTGLHQWARQVTPEAPRMDVLGRRALARLLWSQGRVPPRRRRLQRWALAGDLLSNSAFYDLVALFPGEQPIKRGLWLGVLAGVGGVVLPGPLGLGKGPSGATLQRKAMTVLWYAVGGLVTGAAYQWLSRPRAEG